MPFDLPIPISMIIVGFQYLDEKDCRFTKAPYYLLAGGLIYLILALMRYTIVFCKFVDLQKKDKMSGCLFFTELMANMSMLIWGTINVSGTDCKGNDIAISIVYVMCKSKFLTFEIFFSSLQTISRKKYF